MRWGAVLLLLACPGCAVGDFGTVTGTVTRTPQALVIETVALGIQLRAGPWEELGGMGLGLGWGIRRSVHPPDAAPGLTPGRYWFRVPRPGQGAWLVDDRRYGVDLALTPHRVGVTLGFGATLLTGPADPGTDRRITYDSTRPAAARAQDCTGGGC